MIASRHPVATLLAALIAALGLAACGGDDGGAGTDQQAEAACEAVEQPDPKQVRLRRPRDLEPNSRQTTLLVETNCGEFTIELADERAPKTTASIQHLVDNDVYDDTTFHRIAPGFVIQGGDPRGEGTGGPGYKVTENPPQDLVYGRGVVAMAKTEAEPPGTSGSQFFVVTAPADAGLPTDFALAGEVTDGFETVERIEEQASSPDGPPLQPVVIEDIAFASG